MVLVPDSIEWILGTWCKEFIKEHGEQFEFVILPLGEIRANPTFSRKLILEADIVHCLTPWGYSEVERLCAEVPRQAVVLITTVHHIVKPEHLTPSLSADRILTVCEKYRREVLAAGFSEKDVYLMHNGVDTNFFKPTDKMEARSTLELPLSSMIVGFAGKASSDHDRRKGIDRFIDLLRQLDVKSPVDIVVVTTGPGWDGQIGNQDFRRIKVRNLGFIERNLLPLFYSAIDLYLTTARVEGGPVPVLEALSCGTAVASTPVGMVPEIIISGQNGIIIDFDSERSPVEEILSVIACPSDLERLGKAGRRTALDHLDWKYTLRNLPDLYRLDRPPVAHGMDSATLRRVTTILSDRDRARWRQSSEVGRSETGRVTRFTASSRHAWVERLNNFFGTIYEPEQGLFSSTSGDMPTLYGTVYAYRALAYLSSAVSPSETVKQYVRGCQSQDTGLILGPELRIFEPRQGSPHDLEHLSLHSTSMALPFCQEYGIELSPITTARSFCDLDYLNRWIEQRNWKSAWFEGNNILFIGQLLAYLRDVEQHPAAQLALDRWFEWLDSEADPATGLWGTNGFCDSAVAVYGGYHQLLVYYHENRPLPNPKGLVDTVLSLQHLDGGFNPNGNGGACEDVDSVDILVNCYKRMDYRLAEIRMALWRCVDHILGTQNPDGGFPYGRDVYQSHMDIPGTHAGPNVSCTFPTWFRIHTLALCREIIPDHPALAEMSFGFNKVLSMGWHKSPEGWRLEIKPGQRREERRVRLRVAAKKLGSRVGSIAARTKELPGKVIRKAVRIGRRLLPG